MPSAKEEILAKIQKASVSPDGSLVRSTVEHSSRPQQEIVEQFAEYAAEYRANVIRVAAPDLKVAIRDALLARKSERVLVSADLPTEMRPEQCDVTDDEGFYHLRLDQFQAVVTTCAVAVAETGTVVLDAGAGQGRRAITLIPDHHVCLVREDQVVDTVPEAVQSLYEAVRAGRPLTWISGPSATSDIELSRVEGVHGPRILDILLIRS